MINEGNRYFLGYEIFLSRASQDSGRKQKQGLDELKNAPHCYAHKPERKKEKPDDRIEQKANDGNRPANHKKKEPQQKFDQHETSSRSYTRNTFSYLQ